MANTNQAIINKHKQKNINDSADISSVLFLANISNNIFGNIIHTHINILYIMLKKLFQMNKTDLPCFPVLIYPENIQSTI